VSFTGSTDFEAETYFPQLGVNLVVIAMSSREFQASGP
jgi:hypothetical protein